MYYTERSVASRRNLDFLPLRFLRASYELCYTFLCFEPAEERADVSSISRELYAFADLPPLDDNRFDAGTQTGPFEQINFKQIIPACLVLPFRSSTSVSFNATREKVHRRDKMSKHCELARVCGFFAASPSTSYPLLRGTEPSYLSVV